MASCNTGPRGFFILGFMINLICMSFALLPSQGSHYSQRHFQSFYPSGLKERSPDPSYESAFGQSSSVQNSDSGQLYNGKLLFVTESKKPESSTEQMSQSDSSATVNLFVPTLDKDKRDLKQHNSFISATSTLMDYNEDTRIYMPKNSGRPQTRHLAIRSHIKSFPHQNTTSNDSALYPNESDSGITSHLWRDQTNDNSKISKVSRRFSRTSPQRLHLAIPVRMFVYKRGNTAQDSGDEILAEEKVQVPLSKESPHSSKRIYIPIRFRDDNMLFTTVNHRDCVQCPENYMLTPERGSTYVQVPVPEISVCPYLAFIPGRLNVAIVSGPKVGSMIKEGAYPVELLVWKKGGHTYSCQFSFVVKLAQCPPLPASNVGSIHCSNGTLWGSECHIVCPQNYLVTGPSLVKCEGTLKSVMWTKGDLKCTSKEETLEVKNNFNCTKPQVPIGGTVLCDREASGTQYEDGTICQFFCFPGYVISSEPSNNALAVCQNGQWLPEYKITCDPLHCPQPKQPQNGHILCKEPVIQSAHFEPQPSSKTKYLNGTICKLHCEIGYVIPTSQLPLHIIICAASNWNASSIPDCKRAVPPVHHPDDCKNKTWITEPGINAQMVLPRFISSSGLHLKPTCSLPASLPPGIHVNFCEATDPEFRATSTCSYHIRVMERMPPQPHPDDCKDKILTAGRSGTALLKPTRFLVAREESSYVIEATCRYSKKIGIGSYVNNCSATDSELNTTAYCTFSLTVKGLSCPQLPNISNGIIHCHPKPYSPSVYPPHTICIFKCDDDYVITSSQKKWKKWKCLSKQLQWSQSKIPKCRRAVKPEPYAKDCHYKTLFLKGRKAIWPKKPRFKSTFKGAKVRVRCSLNRPLTAGRYTNFCEAKDVEMGTSTSCTYNITVKAKDCPALPEIPHSEVECFPSDTELGFQIGIACRYVCHAGYIIPLSMRNYETRKCIAFRKWNTSVLPSCIKAAAPTPVDSSCLNQVIIVKDLLHANWTVPDFVTSTEVMLKAVCEPSAIKEYGVHHINCSAHDEELDTHGTCEFTVKVSEYNGTYELDLKPQGCQIPDAMPNSELKCSSNSSLIIPSTVCHYVCLDGYFTPLQQIHLSTIICNNKYEWNSTETPTCEAVSPTFLHPSCPHQSVNTSSPVNVTVEIPSIFVTQNMSANVSCMPSKLEKFGSFEIFCEAYNPFFGISAFCTFTLTVSQLPSFEALANESVLNIPQLDPKISTPPPSISCHPLTSPANGHMNCASNDTFDYCNISCKAGYHFPFAYHSMGSYPLICDRYTGLWSFQKDYNIDDVPDCLGELPSTSWQVWLKFKVAVENCSDHYMLTLQNVIQAQLLILNGNVCNITVDCEQFQFDCGQDDDDGNLFVMGVTWTVEASFNPADYESDDETIPSAETQIEVVLVNTQKAVTVENEINFLLLDHGAHLFQDSYRQGKFILVCQKRGFVVDPKTDKCMECPSGTFEVKGQCEPCPVNHYQDQTGQMACIPCPVGLVSTYGSRNLTECKE